jgi:hypothetical protein
MNYLFEICKNCGLTKGAHSANGYYSDHYKFYIPYDYCPGHQGHMDWDLGPGTIFESSGIFGIIKTGIPARNKKEA